MKHVRGDLSRFLLAGVCLGAPFGAVSGVASYLIGPALAAEANLGPYIADPSGAGPTMLLLLVGMAGGYLSGAVAEAHLGLDGLLAMAAVGLCAAVALTSSMCIYAIAAGDVPEIVWLAHGATTVGWLCGGAKRLYL